MRYKNINITNIKINIGACKYYNHKHKNIHNIVYSKNPISI